MFSSVKDMKGFSPVSSYGVFIYDKYFVIHISMGINCVFSIVKTVSFVKGREPIPNIVIAVPLGSLIINRKMM